MTASLTPEVRDLLASIHEALVIPLPGLADADERAYYKLMERRISDVRQIVSMVLDVPSCLLDGDAKAMRRRTADSPVTYTVWVRPEDRDGGASQ